MVMMAELAVLGHCATCLEILEKGKMLTLISRVQFPSNVPDKGSGVASNEQRRLQHEMTCRQPPYPSRAGSSVNSRDLASAAPSKLFDSTGRGPKECNERERKVRFNETFQRKKSSSLFFHGLSRVKGRKKKCGELKTSTAEKQ